MFDDLLASWATGYAFGLVFVTVAAFLHVRGGR